MEKQADLMEYENNFQLILLLLYEKKMCFKISLLKIETRKGEKCV